MDRTVANALSTCMTHLLRNALDHGIEPTEERIGSKKPPRGMITIKALELKGTIQIVIRDDGRGINPKKVMDQALAKGLISKSRAANLSLEEIYELIFVSGFSTAEQVTEISGRGVGMDVVKSTITGMNGKIKIDSTLGQGTQFTLNIPTPKTVMVDQTVLVKSHNILLAIPLYSIAQLTTVSNLKLANVGHRVTCQYQEKTIVLGRYEEFLGESSQRPETMEEIIRKDCSVVILQYKNKYLGLLVDSIHQQFEAVVRGFDQVVRSFPGFKGTTILGDDSIAYVLLSDEIVTIGLELMKEVAA